MRADLKTVAESGARLRRRVSSGEKQMRVAQMAVIAVAAIAIVGSGSDDGASSTTNAATPASEPAATTEAPEPTAAATIRATDVVDTLADPVPGPALQVDPQEVADAIACTDEGNAGTVLLIHGTGGDPDTSFDAGLLAVLPARGFTTCTVALPGNAVGDIQVTAEYVVEAVRQLAVDYGEPVALVGHSQGALLARWATAFWPDVESSVSMIIAIAGPNAGSPFADELCAAGCAPAMQQMRPGSALLEALDAGSSDVSVPVTAILSVQDELVPPKSASAVLGATVVTVQDICADHVVSHYGLLVNVVAVEALVSALTNGGTPDTAAIGATPCEPAVVEGTDLGAFQAAAEATYGRVLGAPPVAQEPPLAAYAE
jgi:pimeloyl-ACP methyl ester carboxylesterase